MTWEELEGESQKTKMAIQAQAEVEARMAADFCVVFGSDAGRRVLDYMENKTIQKPSMMNYAADGAAMSLLMAIREGENNLYRWILQQIKKGKVNV